MAGAVAVAHNKAMVAHPSDSDLPPFTPTFASALWYWLRLGCISFGGPAGQIAIMHRELVEQRRWISEARFLHALNYCMLLPGPEAQQLATYIGWLLHRTRGGIAAGVLFILPSWFVLVALSWAYMRYAELPLLAAVLAGLKPAVVALVLHAAYRIGARTLRNAWLWSIAIAAFIALVLSHLPFPLVIATAALLGVLGGRVAPASFMLAAHAPSKPHADRAVIDDHSPRLTHTHYRLPRLLLVIASGLALWALPLGILAWGFGWSASPTQMAWFFTRAALLTFGGAYAVLPYVYQGAVVHFGWLNNAQMMDGLALGESTPGPLIMVVTFVGFVGGWQHGPWAPLDFSGALLGAAVTTWFTFLPSFVFILAGGPVIESTRDTLKFTAPLTAITAAVVGVIASLAVFFAAHALWPAGHFNGLAMTLAALAFIALQGWRISVLWVLGASALIYPALQLLHLL